MSSEWRAEISKLEDRMETKCSNTVFWSALSVIAGVLIVLFGFLFTRQNGLSETVASITTALSSVQRSSDVQASTLKDISTAQNEMAVNIGKMSVIIERSSSDMRNLVKEMKKDNKSAMTDSMVARIAREQIAYASGGIKMKSKGGK